MRKLIFYACFLFVPMALHAQATLTGKITDNETDEELIYANIVFYKDGVFVAGTTTDFDGNYSVQLDDGVYEIKVYYTGYLDTILKDVEVKEQGVNIQNISLETGSVTDCTPHRYSFIIPLIEQDHTTSGKTFDHSKIRNAPVKEIKNLIGMAPGVSISNF